VAQHVEHPLGGGARLFEKLATVGLVFTLPALDPEHHGLRHFAAGQKTLQCVTAPRALSVVACTSGHGLGVSTEKLRKKDRKRDSQ